MHWQHNEEILFNFAILSHYPRSWGPGTIERQRASCLKASWHFLLLSSQVQIRHSNSNTGSKMSAISIYSWLENTPRHHIVRHNTGRRLPAWAPVGTFSGSLLRNSASVYLARVVCVRGINCTDTSGDNLRLIFTYRKFDEDKNSP